MSKIALSIAIICVAVTLVPVESSAKDPGAGIAGGSAQPGTTAEVASLDALLDAIRANRKALVAANLQLTDDEATKFWPVYDRYQKEIGEIADGVAKTIQEYAEGFPDLSDDKAMKLLGDYLKLEADRIAVRRNYVPEFSKVLSGRKVARLYQIENKMDAVVRYELAASIPVIDEKEAAATK
jgi:hypothetical protein